MKISNKLFHSNMEDKRHVEKLHGSENPVTDLL